MKTIYSPDGSESRIIHAVDWSGYHGLGWLENKPADPPVLAQDDATTEDDDDRTLVVDGVTADFIRSLPWRDQRAMLSPEQQAKKPEGLTWEDWAISLLVEVADDE